MPPRSALTSSFSITDANNEVVCPLRNQDGSSCRKRCIGVSFRLFFFFFFSSSVSATRDGAAWGLGASRLSLCRSSRSISVMGRMRLVVAKPRLAQDPLLSGKLSRCAPMRRKSSSLTLTFFTGKTLSFYAGTYSASPPRALYLQAPSYRGELPADDQHPAVRTGAESTAELASRSSGPARNTKLSRFVISRGLLASHFLQLPCEELGRRCWFLPFCRAIRM